MKKFKVKSRIEELDMLLNDDPNFVDTKKYLADLIDTAINKVGLTGNEAILAKNKLVHLVKIAANRFLKEENCMEKDYKFSTYFSWYIAQVVNKK